MSPHDTRLGPVYMWRVSLGELVSSTTRLKQAPTSLETVALRRASDRDARQYKSSSHKRFLPSSPFCPCRTAQAMSQRARRTAASAARDAISTAARLQSALIAEQERERVGRRGLSKRVSYAEVPVDEVEGEGEGSGEGEGDVVMDGQAEEAGEDVETGTFCRLWGVFVRGVDGIAQ